MSVMKIQKWGNSQGVRIPKVILDALNWESDENVEISAKDDNIVIKKSISNKKDIDKLFENYKGTYTPIKVEWGTPQGKEIW